MVATKMTSDKRSTYILEGRSWLGTKKVLLRFKTRLEMTGIMLRRVLKGLGGTGVRKG